MNDFDDLPFVRREEQQEAVVDLRLLQKCQQIITEMKTVWAEGDAKLQELQNELGNQQKQFWKTTPQKKLEIEKYLYDKEVQKAVRVTSTFTSLMDKLEEGLFEISTKIVAAEDLRTRSNGALNEKELQIILSKICVQRLARRQEGEPTGEEAENAVRYRRLRRAVDEICSFKTEVSPDLKEGEAWRLDELRCVRVIECLPEVFVYEAVLALTPKKQIGSLFVKFSFEV